MNIEIINDGKGKHQSWEAHASEVRNGWHFSVWGYGADEVQACAELRMRLGELAKAASEGVALPCACGDVP